MDAILNGLDAVRAYLQKLLVLLTSGRLLAAVLAVLAVLRMIQLVGAEVTDEQVTLLFQSGEGLIAAAIALVGAIYSLVHLAETLIKSWGERQPSGVSRFRTPQD